MRFYGREQEIAFLRETRGTAERVARFTVVTGRRRIGKTTLIKEAYKDELFVYFFVARKAESDLCEVYLEEISGGKPLCYVIKPRWGQATPNVIRPRWGQATPNVI